MDLTLVNYTWFIRNVNCICRLCLLRVWIHKLCVSSTQKCCMRLITKPPKSRKRQTERLSSTQPGLRCVAALAVIPVTGQRRTVHTLSSMAPPTSVTCHYPAWALSCRNSAHCAGDQTQSQIIPLRTRAVISSYAKGCLGLILAT